MESILSFKEDVVVQKVENYLVDRGWRLLGKVKIRGRYPDIVALKEQKILVVEAKGSLGDIIRGIGQIIHYSSGANYAYLALPKDMISKDVLAALKGIKIGLIEVDEIVAERLKPIERKPLKSIVAKILKTPQHKPIAKPKFDISKIYRHSAILKPLIKYSEREFTILELSKESGIPYATAWRLVQMLSSQGILITRIIGKATACKLNNESPLLPEIKHLAELQLSAHRAALTQFVTKVRKLKHVKKIILFGSVAKGTEKPSSDVDTAIIVNKESMNLEKQINEIVDEVLKASRIKIVPLVFTEKELSKKEHFKKEIDKGEIVYERA